MSPPPRLGRMDWRAIHGRLEAASRNLQTVLEQSAEQASEAMLERTRRLAQPLAGERQAPADKIEFLRFRLGGATYGLETRYLREVAKLRNLTALPGAAPPLAGIVARRGTLVPVFDLDRRPPSTDAGEPWLLLLGETEIEAALRVASVEDVVALAREDIQAPPAGASGQANLPLSGLAPDMVLLVNGQELLRGDALRLGRHAAG